MELTDLRAHVQEAVPTDHDRRGKEIWTDVIQRIVEPFTQVPGHPNGPVRRKSQNQGRRPRMLRSARYRAAREGCDAIFQLSSRRILAGAEGFIYGGLIMADAKHHTVGRFSCLIWRAKPQSP